MDVTPFHEAEHLARVAADDQGLAVERAAERVERRHNIGNGVIAVILGVRCRRPLRLFPDSRVGLLHHLLAKIDADQIVLEDVVIEHIFGGLPKIDDPLRERRRFDAIGHILRIDRAGGVVIPADAADPAGDEMRIAGILALHEDAVAAEDRRGAVALGNLTVLKIDLGENAETPDDARDRIPVHLNECARGFARARACAPNCGSPSHGASLLSLERMRFLRPIWIIAGCVFGARVAPFRLFVEGVIGELAQIANEPTVGLDQEG